MIVFLAAVVIGLSLGLFGSGGSILTVPILLYLLNMPAELAIASSLFIVGAISLFAATRSSLKRLVSWQHVILFALPSMVGTYFGAWFGTLVDGRWQLLIFAILMFSSAILMWRKKVQPEHNQLSIKPAILIIVGLAVGVITGFVGVGGGFLIVPALVIFGGLAMLRSIATSLVIITLQSSVGFIKYYSVLITKGAIFDWQSISLIIVFGIIGSIIGGAIAHHVPKKMLQRGFAVFLLLMAAVVINQSVL
ncbi:sulfite exporter TauE/SafE family protein [Rheinheimera sp. MMS21-TC3]|uniref:sulfite exporter TauE/SafE family protein n=1 Tax=Rheinheimera sp. MMS21-TC3 TaxID=3072790 RepID=UPI0028C4C504|nr:sulfite exporter TauE/SafE family protein [Rheinheimera sp. MMS21-TC3]WNO61960.1 sulfite exporter TauE/SafE family protein [Rheinheimera sp. MMS21-TC3]